MLATIVCIALAAKRIKFDELCYTTERAFGRARGMTRSNVPK